MMGHGRPDLKQVPVAINKGMHCITDELTAGLLRKCGLWGLLAGVVSGVAASVVLDDGYFVFVSGYGVGMVMGWLIAAVIIFGRASRQLIETRATREKMLLEREEKTARAIAKARASGAFDRFEKAVS